MVRTTSQAKKERDRDKRYQQKYRINIATYNRIGETQGWKCGACGRPASDFTVSLNVDHKHFKITLRRGGKIEAARGWTAETMVRGRYLSAWGDTQTQAKAALMDEALPLSVRGLLCPGRHTGCNRLMGRIDKPEWLKKVIAYLENPPAHKIIA